MSYQESHRELANLLYQALRHDAFFHRLEKLADGNNESKQQAILAYLDYSICEALPYGDCIIPSLQWGISIWSKPLSGKIGKEKAEKKKNFIRQNMGQTSLDFYCQMVDFMSANSASQIPESAWYLSIIGVSPQQQGKGLGARLISETLREADKLNCVTYLETFTPRNISFYQRFGYRTIGTFKHSLFELEYVLMSRNPGG